MKVTVEQTDPVPPPKTVVVRLSEREALALAALAGQLNYATGLNVYMLNLGPLYSSILDALEIPLHLINAARVEYEDKFGEPLPRVSINTVRE